MTLRRSAVEALVRDPVAHGRSQLGRRPGTIADEDVEAQGFRMRSLARAKFRNNARLSEIFNTYSENISRVVYLRKQPLYIIFGGG
jgi:hypothetical protein